MNILLIGGGGREHALSWKLNQSKQCDQLYIAPGNAGTAKCGQNVSIDLADFNTIKTFIIEHSIDMLIIGPEEPLVRGIYDYCKDQPELAQLAIIGPSKEGAKLEGSKAYAKQFMADYKIPTAAYQQFTSDQLKEGLAYIESHATPIVLKADGLAGGKGVLICQTVEEAKAGFNEMLSGKFGAAGNKVVIEQFLDGIEFSVFVLTDGKDYKILPIAKDYKRIGVGDTGLNTGGMGAVSPVPFVDDALMQKVIDQIVEPTMIGIQDRQITYKGFIFIGLIKVDNEPFVIEYNCRLGDPETEVVIPRLKNDLVELFNHVDKETIKEATIQIDEKVATTVMLVSGGYPESYQKGKQINGVDSIQDSIVFHAGTKTDSGQLLTNGGRVLAITSYGDDIENALATSKKNAALISFEGKYFRDDIGFDL